MTRTSLRRYPALGFLAVAALLASLLPSALRVPLSGPSTSAELAPVPGRSDAAQGDLSALGQTSTGGLGAGGDLAGLGTGGRNGGGSRRPNDDGNGGGPPDGGGRNPAQKRCVGNPPRQTEDPLSPACVAYFKGDNGGATAKGVTRDEIVGVQMTGSCTDEPEFFDYDDEGDRRRDPVTAAYLRYFNERFQTYGRRVHLYGVTPPCHGGGDMATYGSLVRAVDERHRPFIFLGYELGSAGLHAARHGMVTTVEGAKREPMRQGAPYVLSYPPDHDNTVESAAEFLCARLAGRTARFALDPTLRIKQRKFGLLYNDGWFGNTEGIDWFEDRVRERCGDAAGEIVVTNPSTFQQRFADMRAQGVTTVVSFFTDLTIPGGAAGMGWYPEWFLPDELYVGGNTGARALWSAQGSSVFGISSQRRLPAPSEQFHRKAVAEGCSCQPTFASLKTYNTFLLLFTGIQAAGPKLTPANLDKGLHALPARRSLDPFTPAAYFAPGNHSFVKDWAAMWWDPAGTPPGTSIPGCWRLVEDGLRYRAEDWQTRPGDDGIQGSDQPCQGDDA